MNKNLALAIQITANSRQADQQMAKMGGSMARMHDRFAKMNNAREALGIRSERAIQREIKQTEAAYNRLHRSGQVGARELSRAYDAMRGKVKGLRQEMEGVTRAQKAMSIGKAGMAVGAGVAAGAYVLAQPVKKVMDYDRDLAMASNTIYSDKNAAGRIAGTKDINAAVESAVRSGGGDRNGALEALNALVSSGSLGEGEAGRKAAFTLLKTVQKYHTGTGAASEDLAAIASKAKGFGIGVNDMPYALDMSIAGGNAGGMEISNQAKWLPSQMSSASKLGMAGTKDFAKLVALNQAAFLGAGTTDAAGNNVQNLLDKFSSQDTAKDFAKQGINVSKELLKGRSKGLDAIDVIADITNRVVSKDKRYTTLQKKLATTSDKDERRALIEQQAKIVEGSAIGKIMNDRQASSALAALLANPDLIKNISAQAIGAKGIGDVNHSVIASTASYQAERLKNESEFAQKSALEGLTKVVGDVSGKLADYAQKYPGISTAIAGATTALTTLAAASAGVTASNLLTGGGVGGATTGAVGGATATGAAARWGSRLLPHAMKAGVAAELMLHSDSLGKDSDGNQLDTMEGMKAWLAKQPPNLNAPRQSLAESNAAYARKFDMSGKLKVEVDVKNNTATVTPAFKDREVQARIDTGRTIPAVTGAVRG